MNCINDKSQKEQRHLASDSAVDLSHRMIKARLNWKSSLNLPWAYGGQKVPKLNMGLILNLSFQLHL